MIKDAPTLADIRRRIPHTSSQGKVDPPYKMNASQSHLPWQSFATVDEGKRLRNALAHDATLLNEEGCLLYIRAVEEELQAWSIIPKNDA